MGIGPQAQGLAALEQRATAEEELRGKVRRDCARRGCICTGGVHRIRIVAYVLSPRCEPTRSMQPRPYRSAPYKGTVQHGWCALPVAMPLKALQRCE